MTMAAVTGRRHSIYSNALIATFAPDKLNFRECKTDDPAMIPSALYQSIMEFPAGNMRLSIASPPELAQNLEL
jgi:hypothetical protein